MKITGTSFLGFIIPNVPTDTTNFDLSSYGIWEILHSILNEKMLTLNTGENPGDYEFFIIRIEGIGEVDSEIAYYPDSKLVWGKWIAYKDDKIDISDLCEDFIGTVSGLEDERARFNLKLNPEKISAE